MEGATMATTDGAGAKKLRPLRVGQVATRIGAEPRAVLRLIDDGEFPGAYRLRERGHWRVPQDDVAAYLARRPRAVPTA
jgi:excisionase family DNA binding protein